MDDPTTRLHALCAASPLDPAAIEAAVREGADVRSGDKRGITPLHRAAAHRHLDLVRTLLALGADPSARSDDADHHTPLHSAMGYRVERCLPVVELLLDHGAEVNVPNSIGQTAVFQAIAQRLMPVVERLVAAGSDLNRHYEGGILGETAFGHSVTRWPESVPRLVELGADPNAPQRRGGSVLWRPVFDGNTELIELLIHLGSDVNRPADDGKTILAAYIAFPRRCRPEVLKLLLGHGAAPNHRDAKGRTALHEAVTAQEVETVQVLLAGGADPDLPDDDGVSPRDLARSPLVTAALGEAAPLDRSDITGLLVSFLRDGLVFRSGDWTLECHGDSISERRPGHRQARNVDDTYVEEVFGYVLLREDAALADLEVFLDTGFDAAGEAPLGPGEARRRFIEGQPALVRVLEVEVRPADAGTVIADALATGLTLSTGNREGWTRWSAQPGGTFLFEAGDHFGPEGDAHDVHDRASLVAAWGRRFRLERGRLEGSYRGDLDRALRHLGLASVRRWKAQAD